MKRHMLCFLLFICIQNVFSQDLTGPQIIQSVNDVLNPETMWGKSTMTIETSSGEKRTFLYESWSKNHGEKNLIKYLEPSRVKDQSTLMLHFADDIWMYFPRTNRVRKLATHAKKQKMEGSDFSYEDFGAGNTFLEDYTSIRLEDKKVDDQLCYQIELTKKMDSDAGYSKLILYARQDNYVPVQIDYYDENDLNRLIKILHLSDIRTFDGIPTAMKMIMVNQSDQSRTISEMLEVKFNLPLDDDLFTERGMKQ